MIKIFGQIRYHWQPELSLAVIYWSLTTMPLFLALSLLYEKTKKPELVFLLVGLTICLTLLGVHRFFLFKGSILRVISFNPWTRQNILVSEIKKVEVSKYRLCLHLTSGKTKTFFMRKWAKKYFLDDLACHQEFQGEVELVDNISRIDYFKLYRKDKKPLVKN